MHFSGLPFANHVAEVLPGTRPLNSAFLLQDCCMHLGNVSAAGRATPAPSNRHAAEAASSSSQSHCAPSANDVVPSRYDSHSEQLRRVQEADGAVGSHLQSYSSMVKLASQLEHSAPCLVSTTVGCCNVCKHRNSLHLIIILDIAAPVTCSCVCNSD